MDRRARSGDFRIVFFVSNNTILITKIGLRKKMFIKRDFGCHKLSRKHENSQLKLNMNLSLNPVF